MKNKTLHLGQEKKCYVSGAPTDRKFLERTQNFFFIMCRVCHLLLKYYSLQFIQSFSVIHNAISRDNAALTMQKGIIFLLSGYRNVIVVHHN